MVSDSWLPALPKTLHKTLSKLLDLGKIIKALNMNQTYSHNESSISSIEKCMQFLIVNG